MKFIIDELFKNNQIDTVVEPFCGSCAVSFYIFNNHDPEKKIKYLINDNDKLLIDFLQHIKINGSDKLFNEINEILKLPYEDYKLKFNDIKSEYKTKPNIFNYLFYNKIYTYRRGLLIPEDKYKNIFINYERSKKINDNLDLFFKNDNLTLFNLDYLEFLNNVNKLNKKTFIYFDPPYLNSHNSDYNTYLCNKLNKDYFINDNTYMYIFIKYLLSKRINILLTINKNSLNEYIYGKYIKLEYRVIYQYTNNNHKKNTIHMLAYNF